MIVRTEKVGEATLVVVKGPNLDASNTGEFRAAIAPLVDENTHLIIDVGELEFVDSSGLGAFLACLRQLNGKNGSLKLCRMRKPVRTLFELVRMHRVFDIYNTPAEATATDADA